MKVIAYNELLADRIHKILSDKNIQFYEIKMFGGLCFMVNDKMCLGIVNNGVMARVGVEKYEESLKIDGCNEMNFTGRPMKGYVFLEEEATDLDKDLEYWVQLALNFNPFAKSSKKK